MIYLKEDSNISSTSDKKAQTNHGQQNIRVVVVEDFSCHKMYAFPISKTQKLIMAKLR